MNQFEEIQKYKEHFTETFKNVSRRQLSVCYKDALNTILKQINTLENIYKFTSDFRQEFKDLAYKERQHLCLESSALYVLIRELKAGVEHD